MTTIRDMLIADLRAIGAAGVACFVGNDQWVTHPLHDTDRIDSVQTLFGARPAFLDDDGRLVPLPDGWEVGATGALRGPLIRGFGHAMITHRRDGQYSLRGTARTKITVYPTAPEAWAAAEAWLKEQGT